MNSQRKDLRSDIAFALTKTTLARSDAAEWEDAADDVIEVVRRYLTREDVLLYQMVPAVTRSPSDRYSDGLRDAVNAALDWSGE